jgi:hypothetical protein
MTRSFTGEPIAATYLTAPLTELYHGLYSS